MVSLRAVWEGSAGVPSVVQTIEIRITTGQGTMRELVDPQQAPGASIAGVPLGDATVEIFGYDVRLLGLPDLTEVEVAPSYASDPESIFVRGGTTTDAGEIEVRAQPFLTQFGPLPGEVDVLPSTRVEFLLVIAVGAIEAGSIDVTVDGVAQVVAGEALADSELEPCVDGTTSPCGSADLGLSGFRFRASSAALPAFDTVAVEVDAAGGEPARALSYQYSFDTADDGEG